MTERVNGWPNTGATQFSGGGLVLSCSGCGLQKKWTKVLPAHRVREKAEADNWEIGKKWREAKCPDCRKADQTETDLMEITKAQQDKQVLKRTIALLASAYDESTRAYKSGWDDREVAKNVKTTPEQVASIRAEYFGPAEDPRIGELREALTKLRTNLDNEAAELSALLADHERRAKAAIDDLGQRLAKVTGRP